MCVRAKKRKALGRPYSHFALLHEAIAPAAPFGSLWTFYENRENAVKTRCRGGSCAYFSSAAIRYYGIV